MTSNELKPRSLKEMCLAVLVYSLLLLPPVLSQSRELCQNVPECVCEKDDNDVNSIHATCTVDSLVTTVMSLPENTTSLEIKCVTAQYHTLPSDMSIRLPWLHKLDISDCHFGKMDGNTFNSFSLRTLRLGSNVFTNSEFMWNTSSLSELEISNCGLTSFPDISNLHNLVKVNLSFNRLSSYGTFDTAYKNVPCKLEQIDLTGNNFKDFPNLLPCASSLRTLKLGHNGRTKLGENYFPGLENLQVIDLTASPLEGDIGSLNNLVNLTSLRLSGSNQIFNFTPADHPKLIDLFLQDFILHDTSLAEMSSLDSLLSLTLTSCNISSIDQSLFSNMTYLRHLDLSVNSLSSIKPGTLDNLLQLKHLNLSNNALRHLYRRTITNRKLEVLDLSENRIKFILSGSFANLRNLKFLNLTSNHISNLHRDMFGDLVSLEKLFLKRVGLMTLPSFANCSRLLMLDLKENKLPTLAPSAFKGLKSLIGISLKSNRMRALRSTLFVDSPEMTFLDASENQIATIEKHPSLSTPWGNLDKLNFLKLDSNNLHSLTNDLSLFMNLQYLFLDGNKIWRVEADMFPASLVTLSLSGNRLGSVGDLFSSNLANLKQVNLVNNSPYLRTLASYNFYTRTAFKPTVFLGANIFDCDCRMRWLKEVSKASSANDLPRVLRRTPTFPDLDYVFCYGENDTLVSLKDYPTSEFMCVYEKDDFECLLSCPCCSGSLSNACACRYLCPVGCTCRKALELFRQNEVQCDKRGLVRVPPSLPPDATSIDLSGNALAIVENDSFQNLNDLEILYLNNSRIKWLTPGSFDGLNKVVALYLDNNVIRSIPSGLFEGLKSLRFLYLHHNVISFIASDAFHNLVPGVTLTLHQNQLYDLTSLTFLAGNNFEGDVTLSDNKWSCDCDVMDELQDIVTLNARRIVDVNKMACFWKNVSEIYNLNGTVNVTEVDVDGNFTELTTLLLDFDYSLVCSNVSVVLNHTIVQEVRRESKRFRALLIGMIFLFVMMITAAVLLVWKRRFLQVVIYTKFGVRFVPADKGNTDANFQYDLFVSHSSKDHDFVLKELMLKLEQERNLKLCLDFRDFPVGEDITENVVKAVEGSRRTLIVVSDNYLESEWCRFEFQAAHQEVLMNHRESIIVVLLEEVNQELVDPDLRDLLKTRTYLKHGDPWFWEKLFFALPDAKRDAGRDAVDGALEDKEIKFEILDKPEKTVFNIA